MSEPLPLSEASLLALRPALNAPVLNVQFLPVGPARAAIVVFAEEYGGIGLAIGVRSNEGGQVAVFQNQEPIEADVPIEEALESALSAAERLGFLFDEDMMSTAPGGEGRSQALALWGRLMGELELPDPPKAVPSQPATSESILDPSASSTLNTLAPIAERTAALAPDAAEVPELLLDEVTSSGIDEISLDLEADDLSGDSPGDAPSANSVAAPESAIVAEMPPQPQLSRFRNDPSATASRTETGGGSTLGRIPLVRVRREGSKRVPFLTRLLSSF